MNEKFVINIGRQLGSGGREIGEKLALQFSIAFYDKELIQLASKESGLGKEFFEEADEKKSHSFIGGLLGMRTNTSNEVYVNNYLSNETFFKIQSDVIRKLAAEKSCVFVGRCADYILRDHPRCINVFITADTKDRVKRVATDQQLTGEKAQDVIEKTDKNRAGYYNYFSNKVWGAAGSYHLCINSSVLGIDETVAFISRFVEQKLG
ncbi:MAG: cytidylate kinase-like family protein [Bacteroidota bacterium]|nr:cytidylate kinase-like family protein [Bacteroidota bacterium]